jgi:hypothetical protein
VSQLEVQLHYREGDVGDGARFEASVDVYDAAGTTPGDALANLAAVIAAANPSDEPEAEPEPATAPAGGFFGS